MRGVRRRSTVGIGVKLAIVIGRRIHRQSKGMGRLQAGALLGFLDAIGDRAEGDAGEDRDDPYDHEKFDKGETASIERMSGTTEETVG